MLQQWNRFTIWMEWHTAFFYCHRDTGAMYTCTQHTAPLAFASRESIVQVLFIFFINWVGCLATRPSSKIFRADLISECLWRVQVHSTLSTQSTHNPKHSSVHTKLETNTNDDAVNENTHHKWRNEKTHSSTYFCLFLIQTKKCFTKKSKQFVLQLKCVEIF